MRNNDDIMFKDIGHIGDIFIKLRDLRNCFVTVIKGKNFSCEIPGILNDHEEISLQDLKSEGNLPYQTLSGLLCWWIFVVPEVALNLAFLSIFQD